MNYEIIDVDALGRIGKLRVNNKELITPNLFPVVHPFKNLISTTDFKKIGAECLFTNSYIIYQNENLKKDILNQGIHNYLNFNGIIATDSGAFQQYMYNNNRIDIDAAEIERFQEKINSDFTVILDVPVQLDDDYLTAKEKVKTTIERAKDNIKRRSNKNCHWFGPIHGGRYTDLLRYSAIEMSKLDFDVYSLGGLVKAFLGYRFDLAIQILLNAKAELIPNKPVHMFGLGLPQFFSLAVACGCDLMDSAAYILFAKEHRYFTLSTGTKRFDELEEFPCNCPICCEYTPREIRTFDETLLIQLIAKHNLYVSFSELKTIRQAIREGNLWELVEQRIRNHPALVKAARTINKHQSFFEKYEKVYKNHGRLYTSNFDINRPLIDRYESKIINNYRSPEDVKYLIILPELDSKGINSPSIRNWVEIINEDTTIPRHLIHVVLQSCFYGIIPLELTETFPLGQYESINPLGNNDLLYESSLNKAKTYFTKNIKKYEKCGILVPDNFLNQFEEIESFSDNHPIHGICSLVKSNYDLVISKFNDLKSLLQFFRDDNK